MAIHPGAYCMDVGAMANFKDDAADHSVAPVDQIALGVRLGTCRWHRAVEYELLHFVRGQKRSIKRDLQLVPWHREKSLLSEGFGVYS